MDRMIHVRVSDELRKELEQVLKEEKGVSQSEFIREAVRKYLDIKKFRNLRKKVLPFAESQGLLTDEDVFESIK